MPKETAFELATSSIRFGRGVTAEVGMDLAELKARNVMVVADPNLRSSLPVTTVFESLETYRVPFKLFNAVRAAQVKGEQAEKEQHTADDFDRAGQAN